MRQGPVPMSTASVTSRRLPIAIAVVAVVALALFAWWRAGAGGDPAAALRTAEVDRGDVRVLVAASGNLAAVSTVEVGTQVSGQLIDLPGDFNLRVTAGDVIARIDPQPFEGRVQQARADLASAQAALASARAQRVEAQQLQQQALRELERRRSVQARGLISVVDLEASEVALQQAEARMHVTAAGIRTAEASVAQRQAALENASFDLARTEIRSPVDGVIIARNVSRGQTVAASLQTPVLFSIAEDLAQMQIVLAIDESDVGQVKPGQVARFTVDAFPRREFRGVVEQVRLAATNVSNVITYPVVIAVDNSDLTLLPGMTANAEIEISARRDVLRLPNAALRFAPATVAGAGGTPRDGRPGAAGGPPRASWADDLARKLSLNDAQQARLQELLAAGRGGGRPPGAGGSMSGGGERPDPAVIEKRMRERMDAVLGALEPELTAEQLQALSAWREQQAQTRMVQVHVPVGGVAEPRRVRVGIGDAQYTELVDGPLQEGDRVVTGYAAPPR
jgi:HlyD family secretion protein